MTRFTVILSFLALIVLLVPSHLVADSETDAQNAFNRGVEYYNTGSYGKAQLSFESAAKLYALAGGGGSEGVLYSYLWAGASASYQTEYEVAIEYYNSALEVSVDLNDRTAELNILTARANARYALADYQKAGETYLRILALTRQLHPENTAGVLQFAGYLHVAAGEYKTARELYTEALDLVSGSGDDTAIAGVMAMLGNSAYNLKHFNESLEWYSKAASIMENGESKVELSRTVAWQGLVAYHLGEYKNAVTFYKKALELLKAEPADDDMARVLASLGQVYEADGNIQAAVNSYLASLEIAQRLGNTEFLIAANDSLAYLHERNKEPGRSLRHRLALEKLYKSTSRFLDQALELNAIGSLYYDLGRHGESVRYFEDSLELMIDLNVPPEAATVAFNLGAAHEETGNSEESIAAFIRSFEFSLEAGNSDQGVESASLAMDLMSESYRFEDMIGIYERLAAVLQAEEGREAELATLLNNTGVIYYSLSDYESAISRYSEALDINGKLGNVSEQSIQLHNLGQSYKAIGGYDTSLAYYRRSLAAAETADNGEARAGLYNSIGELYRAWGKYETSIEYYTRSETMYTELNMPDGLASVYNNFGQALRQLEDYESALDYYNRSFELFQKSGDREGEAISLSNTGEALRQMGDLERALEHYLSALAIDLEIGNQRGAAVRNNNIGLIEVENGRYERAIEFYARSLPVFRSLGMVPDVATALNNLGEALFYLERYSQAVDHFTESIEIKEKLRETAVGKDRRDYLASQIHTYNNLSVAYFFMGRLADSFDAIELGSSKYLAEQMKSGENPYTGFGGILKFQETLGGGTAVYSAASTDREMINVIGVERDSMYSALTEEIYTIVPDIYEKYGREISRKTRLSDASGLTGILEYYRYLIARPVPGRSERDAYRYIARALYDLLIGPLEEELVDVADLVVIPSGSLALIPFETLIMPDGRYLVERYHIRYTQSLTVLSLLKERQHLPGRKSLLAFGGAVYDEAAYSLDMSRASEEADTLVEEAHARIESGESTRGMYESLGYGRWANLPGTFAEVEAIGRLVPDAEVLTGARVSEPAVRRMSSRGELARYRVIHFATHGIVVPEVPELSAVVLSQFAQEDPDHDGYLTMGEIAEMDIQADFVNLSACETGLGKVYAGEGVVGLTQAFLIAGANGLSVSLWKVSDQSTMRFMTGLYRQVSNGTGYDRALTSMKREFIADPRYAHPFFWAPFVYYGR